MASVGNLSRAGKVKRSTPHVEKTEKERRKTGRAANRERWSKRNTVEYSSGRMAMNPQN